MTSKEEILSYLKEKKEEFFSDYQLVKLGLFGSFARGEATKDSDIDLIVEFEPNTQNLAEKKLSIKSTLKKQFHREVDVCREKYIKPYFKSQILESVIYI